MGSAVNQVEAPFSWESSMERWWGVGRLCWSSFASSFCFVHLVCWILLLMLCWTEWQLPNWWSSWLMIRSTSGALIYCEAACCSFAEAAGFVKPKPPSHAGSANISCICFPGGGCPVCAGIKSEWIAFSRDSRMSSDWFSSQSVTLKSSTLKIVHEWRQRMLHVVELQQFYWAFPLHSLSIPLFFKRIDAQTREYPMLHQGSALTLSKWLFQNLWSDSHGYVCHWDPNFDPQIG